VTSAASVRMIKRATVLMARSPQLERSRVASENQLQRWIKIVPEITAARDYVLPEPRLGFVDARRNTSLSGVLARPKPRKELRAATSNAGFSTDDFQLVTLAGAKRLP